MQIILYLSLRNIVFKHFINFNVIVLQLNMVLRLYTYHCNLFAFTFYKYASFPGNWVVGQKCKIRGLLV